MFKDTPAFSSFSVDNSEKAMNFYGQTLGMDINPIKGMEDYGVLELHIAGNNQNVFIYPKDDYEPATFTVLNFPVDDIDATLDELDVKGVKFEQLNNPAMPQDEKGVWRGMDSGAGANMAWFKDSAGNFLALMQQEVVRG